MSVTADQHFAIVPEWVLYADISAHAVRLYGVLRRYADKAGKAHPSRATLAEHIHASVPTVKRAMSELIELGAVNVAPRHDEEGRRTSNQYVVMATPPRVADDPVVGVTEDPDLRFTGDPETIASSEPKLNERENHLRDRDPVFDALAEIEGLNLAEIDDATGTRLGVALAKIRRTTPNLTPGELFRRAENYSSHFHDATVTANAIAKWWPRLDRPGRNGSKPYDNAAEILKQAMGGGDGTQPGSGPRGIDAGVLPGATAP